MDFWLVFIVLFVAFWSVFGCCSWWQQSKTEKEFEKLKQPMLCRTIYAGVFGTAAVLWYFYSFVPVIPYAFLMIASLGLVYADKRLPSVRTWWLVLAGTCFAGVLALAYAIPGLQLTWYEHILYPLFWFGFVGLFMLFDQVPCCSVLQSFIWGIAAVFAVMLRIPLLFSILGSALWVVLWSLSKVMVRWNMPSLGRSASIVVGFLWGFVFTLAVAYHAVLPVMFMLNCYIFALTFGLFLVWQMTKKIDGTSYLKLYQALPPKAQLLTVNAILTHCGLLSLLGVLFWHISDGDLPSGYYIFAVIVFLDLYYRIKEGGEPAPGIKQLFSEMKAGIKTGIAHTKQELANRGWGKTESSEKETTTAAGPAQKRQKAVVTKRTVKRKKK